MTTAQISMIAPPPSVAAVLGALTEQTRIGQVDFSTRLAPEVDELDPADQTDRSADHEPVDQPDEYDEFETLDEADEATDLAEETDTVGDTDQDEHDNEAIELTRSPVTLVAVPDRVEASRTQTSRTQAEPAKAEPVTVEPTDVEAPPVEQTDLEPIVTDHTDHTELKATPVTKPTRPSARKTGAPAQQRRPEPQPAPQMEERPVPASSSIHDRIHEPARLERDRFEATTQELQPTEQFGERPPSIEEIARGVVERMHDAELAMMRHLEAVEAEAARRCELATAQAELDAELIRLNARREAHALVAVARERAGHEAEEADEAERALDEVAESLTRFADVMEELRPSPGSGHTS